MRYEGVIYRPKSGADAKENETEEVSGSRTNFPTEQALDSWLNNGDILPVGYIKIKNVSNQD